MATMTKKTCPITRDQFNQKAMPLKVVVGSQALVAEPKEFSTGSLGWYAGGKLVVEIDGKPCTVQVGLNLTLVGSKELE